MPAATFPANTQRNASSQIAPAPHRKTAAQSKREYSGNSRLRP